VNTGIGEFSEVVLNDEQVKEFQKYLIYNHAAGIGDPMPLDWVRGAMLGRINVHAHGNSGVRIEITQTLVDMLNKGVTPFVCQKGSVGACGDLAPMSQIALLMMGEGHAYYEGTLYPGKEALAKAGIPIPGLQARDGLATINGSNVLTAMSALFLYDANNWMKQAEIAASMSLEAMKANMRPYLPKLHEVRGFKGAIRSAASIRKCVEGGIKAISYFTGKPSVTAYEQSPGNWMVNILPGEVIRNVQTSVKNLTNPNSQYYSMVNWEEEYHSQQLMGIVHVDCLDPLYSVDSVFNQVYKFQNDIKAPTEQEAIAMGYQLVLDCENEEIDRSHILTNKGTLCWCELELDAKTHFDGDMYIGAWQCDHLEYCKGTK